MMYQLPAGGPIRSRKGGILPGGRLISSGPALCSQCGTGHCTGSIRPRPFL